MALFGRFFERLDRKSFLNIHIWEFSSKSFFKEYARLFFVRSVLKHPRKTFSGIRKYQKFIKPHEDLFPQYHEGLALPDEQKIVNIIRDKKAASLLGLGFCLKPYDPKDETKSCPAGQANHECLYLETGRTQEICSGCAIYKIAKKGLAAGCSIYIMTSAKDIAADFLLPQIDRGLFPAAILLLCPYSVQAILPALFICSIEAYLIAYESGYCKDYQEWRRADLGTKEERTSLSVESWKKLFYLLDRPGNLESKSHSFRRDGNIFHPE